MAMPVTPDGPPEDARVSFDQRDGFINCEPVFTWRFLKNEGAQRRSNPFISTLGAVKNRS